MQNRLRYLALIGLVMLALAAGLAGGVVLDRRVLTPAPPTGALLDMHLLAEASDAIQSAYVDRTAVQSDTLTYGAISGMVDALGDTGHSRFLSPEMLHAEQSFEQGQFEGIGVEVEMRDGHVVVVAPIDDTPAQQAGIHAGDIIAKVNGVDITDLPLNQVVDRILGPAGTQVTITILDPTTGDSRDVTLERAHIVLHNVTWQMLPGTTIAHVRIAAFSQGVTQDLQKALADVQQAGATGIVLDLRNNPGGLLGEAIGVTSLFVSDGNVLLEKNAQGAITPVPVRREGLVTKLPVVVLINRGTASAAEITAGALQDAGRARLVGETTFGTGTVLNQFALSDGSALLLATEEWLTPKGRVIWHAGIAPDVAVAIAANGSPLLPSAERELTAGQLQASRDAQLLQAMQLVTASGAND